MKPFLISALAVLVAAPAFAQSSPPGWPPAPPSIIENMRAEHERFEAAWAQCRKISDGTTRAGCYEKLHDEAEATRAKREAELRSRIESAFPPPPPPY